MGMMYFAVLAAEERNAKEEGKYSRGSSNNKPSYLACNIYELSENSEL